MRLNFNPRGNPKNNRRLNQLANGYASTKPQTLLSYTKFAWKSGVGGGSTPCVRWPLMRYHRAPRPLGHAAGR